MASKITTYCDITRQVCHQTFRIGIQYDGEDYIMDLNKEGLMLLMSSMINEMNGDTMCRILDDLIGPKWQETLVQNQ